MRNAKSLRDDERPRRGHQLSLLQLLGAVTIAALYFGILPFLMVGAISWSTGILTLATGVILLGGVGPAAKDWRFLAVYYSALLQLALHTSIIASTVFGDASPNAAHSFWQSVGAAFNVVFTFVTVISTLFTVTIVLLVAWWSRLHAKRLIVMMLLPSFAVVAWLLFCIVIECLEAASVFN